MQAVYARTADGRLAKGLTFESYEEALAEWSRLDSARLDGLFPQVKHFEVRDTDDPKYADAVRLPWAFARVITPRGFGDEQYTPGRRTLTRTGAEKAASKAWKLFAPKPMNRIQGDGGWFYYEGTERPAAQGLRDLAVVAQRHNLIAQGANGRWYVTEIADSSHFEAKKPVAV